jgi:predicted transposase/invertase (TIGR01784 family)
MQVAKIEGFEKRAQYYAAKTYCSHFGEGGKYPDLKKVIFLAITDYVVFPKKEGYKSDHVILDNVSHEHDLKDFYFTFVELPKFTKSLEDLKTIEDKWYYFLKHADESKDIEQILSHHPEIKEAYEILDRYHWTEGELQYYEKLIMNVADAHGMIAAAKTEGREEGRQEGRQEGLQEGIEKGVKEGHIEVAKAMREKGLPIDQIVLMTSLSEEEVLALSLSELVSKTTDDIP